MDTATIAKTTRIAGAEKNIEELAGKELVSFESGKYVLTELGAKVSHKVKKLK